MAASEMQNATTTDRRFIRAPPSLRAACGRPALSCTKAYKREQQHVNEFGCDFQRDILSIRSLTELEDERGRFDVVVASPPCQAFSLLACWRHWKKVNGRREPHDETARQGLRLMQHTFKLIADYEPRLWVIENPRGLMRFMAPTKPSTTVWYCKLGEKRAKPTDLWTNLSVRFPDQCRYAASECDHIKVKSGQRAGTMALKTAAERSVIPYGLGLTVCLGAEFLLLGELAVNHAGVVWEREKDAA